MVLFMKYVLLLFLAVSCFGCSASFFIQRGNQGSSQSVESRNIMSADSADFDVKLNTPVQP